MPKFVPASGRDQVQINDSALSNGVRIEISEFQSTLIFCCVIEEFIKVSAYPMKLWFVPLAIGRVFVDGERMSFGAVRVALFVLKQATNSDHFQLCHQ